jgi:hypothetical protein
VRVRRRTRHLLATCLRQMKTHGLPWSFSIRQSAELNTNQFLPGKKATKKISPWHGDHWEQGPQEHAGTEWPGFREDIEETATGCFHYGILRSSSRNQNSTAFIARSLSTSPRSRSSKETGSSSATLRFQSEGITSPSGNIQFAYEMTKKSLQHRAGSWAP